METDRGDRAADLVPLLRLRVLAILLSRGGDSTLGNSCVSGVYLDRNEMDERPCAKHFLKTLITMRN